MQGVGQSFSSVGGGADGNTPLPDITLSGSSSASSGISAGEIISGAASGFGILANLAKSRAQAKSLEQQASRTDANAQVERVNADATQNLIRSRLNETLAANQAALSVSGIDPTSGSARLVQERSVSAGNKAISETDTNARIRVAALRREAEQLRQAARDTRKSAKSSAKLGILTTALNIYGSGAA